MHNSKQWSYQNRHREQVEDRRFSYGGYPMFTTLVSFFSKLKTRTSSNSRRAYIADARRSRLSHVEELEPRQMLAVTGLFQRMDGGGVYVQPDAHADVLNRGVAIFN